MKAEIVNFFNFLLKELNVVVGSICKLSQIALLLGDIVEYLQVQSLGEHKVAPGGIDSAKQLLIKVFSLTLYSPDYCVASPWR